MDRRILLLAACAALLPGLAAAGPRPGQRIAVTPTLLEQQGPRWAGVPKRMQDVFVTELVSSGMQAGPVPGGRRSLTLSGDVDPSTRKQFRGRGFSYVLTSVLTGGSRGRQGRQAGSPTVSTRLIDTSTGEIVWVRREPLGVSVGGFGGGVDDNRVTEALRKPVKRLVADLKATKL